MSTRVLLLASVLLPVLAGGVAKAFVYAGADVTIVEHPAMSSENFATEEQLGIGYLFLETECQGQPCITYLERLDLYTLLRFDLPDPQGPVKAVVLYLPVSELYAVLPDWNFQDLCRFSVARLDTPFSESKVTWEELEPGVPWNPEDHVDPLGDFYVSFSTPTPIAVDLTDELKDEVEAGGTIYLALVPDPAWWEYDWEEGHTCQALITSSEGGSGPMLYVEYGPPEGEGEDEGSHGREGV